MNNRDNQEKLSGKKRPRAPNNNGYNYHNESMWPRNTKRRKIKSVSFNPLAKVRSFIPTGSLTRKVNRHSTTRKNKALLTEENRKQYLNRSAIQAKVAHEYAKIMNTLDLSNENKFYDIKLITDKINSSNFNTDMNLLLKEFIYRKYYSVLTPGQKSIYKMYFKQEEERLKGK